MCYFIGTIIVFICNRVNVTIIAALRRVCKLIPQRVIVNIYEAFILPCFEYCSPVLGGLSYSLSNKLTNQYAIRSLMNMSIVIFI